MSNPEVWASVFRWPEQSGCVFGGHLGQYIYQEIIELARAYGFEVPNEPVSPGEDFEWTVEVSDLAIEYLNKNIAAENYSFGWEDGEFFYRSIFEWQGDLYDT